jgi:CubicO group peptidase (beta-lactamase class C family)
VSALDQVMGWPCRAAAGWTDGNATHDTGPADEEFEWASVTKVVTAVAVWVAVEEGTVSLEDRAGPPGATLAHLMAHASGLAVDDRSVVARPGERRIYSNSGIEAAAEHVSVAASMPFVDYATEAVLEPLAMTATTIVGSPAWGGRGPLADLLRLARELLAPSLVSASTVEHMAAVAFPGLDGILPGIGLQAPNDWGIGVEIRGSKRPHWTGTANSRRTFGHFGRSGSWIWVDPDAGVAAASLADRRFGPWSLEAWPALSDAVLVERAGSRAPS